MNNPLEFYMYLSGIKRNVKIIISEDRESITVKDYKPFVSQYPKPIDPNQPRGILYRD
jgi:hypothetical protein